MSPNIAEGELHIFQRRYEREEHLAAHVYTLHEDKKAPDPMDREPYRD